MDQILVNGCDMLCTCSLCILSMFIVASKDPPPPHKCILLRHMYLIEKIQLIWYYGMTVVCVMYSLPHVIAVTVLVLDDVEWFGPLGLYWNNSILCLLLTSVLIVLLSPKFCISPHDLFFFFQVNLWTKFHVCWYKTWSKNWNQEWSNAITSTHKHTIL